MARPSISAATSSRWGSCCTRWRPAVLPFAGKNPHEVLKRIGEGRFADPRTVSPRVSDHLAKVIARSLARNPNDRYPRITLMLDDLCTYVVDAGLENPREELRQYFTAPETYEKGLDHRLATALVASGQREQATGRTARALELWNRALALEPENPTVLAELRRLERGARLRRWVTVAVVAGAACRDRVRHVRHVAPTPCGHGRAEMASGSSPSLHTPGATGPIAAGGPKAPESHPKLAARPPGCFRSSEPRAPRAEKSRGRLPSGPTRARRPHLSCTQPRPTRKG